MLPSKPLVNNRLSLGLYSMFFTQLECPWRVRILCFKFLASHKATVLSSEQVANMRWSRNLSLTRMLHYMYTYFTLHRFVTKFVHDFHVENFMEFALRTSHNWRSHYEHCLLRVSAFYTAGQTLKYFSSHMLPAKETCKCQTWDVAFIQEIQMEYLKTAQAKF